MAKIQIALMYGDITISTSEETESLEIRTGGPNVDSMNKTRRLQEAITLLDSATKRIRIALTQELDQLRNPFAPDEEKDDNG
jgi:hypothetical protein